MKLECEFNFWKFDSSGFLTKFDPAYKEPSSNFKIYGCQIKSFSQTDQREIEEVQGEHFEGKSNDDVQLFSTNFKYFHLNGDNSLKHFPRGL